MKVEGWGFYIIVKNFGLELFFFKSNGKRDWRKGCLVVGLNWGLV